MTQRKDGRPTPPLGTPPTRPKGHRPYYFDDPAVDQLYSAFLALSTELAVALQRIDTLERVLEARGGVSREDLERYVPDDEAASEREARRADLAARVLKPFVDYREDLFARAEHSAAASAHEPSAK